MASVWNVQREFNLDDANVEIYSGRATSAAPIYFKPYHHSKTHRTYIDGAIRRNNPVRIADEERRLIWPGSCRLDIVLSVGSGLSISQSRVKKKVASTKKGVVETTVPRGLREYVRIVYDMMSNALSCEKEWDDFVESYRSEPGITDVCHRLNVALRQDLPKIDDVGKIDFLQKASEEHLRSTRGGEDYFNPDYQSAKEHIQAIARRLLSALFYFDVSYYERNGNVRGHIKCRLGSAMKSQFNSLLNEDKTFRLWDSGGVVWEKTNPSFNSQTFSSEEFHLAVDDRKRRSWQIEVQFSGRSPRWEPISNFSF